ncbi:MAG: transcriptional regulator [Pseudomonadota bacterium]
MQTHQALRVEIMIESPMARRLTDAIEAAGVTGYTVLPVQGGSGRSGTWSREGQITGGMLAVVCIIQPDRKDALLEAAFSVVERHIGVIAISACEVLRAERF